MTLKTEELEIKTASRFSKALRALFPLLFVLYLVFIAVFSLAGTEAFLRFGFWRPGFDLDGLNIILDRKMLFRIEPGSRSDINSRGHRGPDFRVWKKGMPRILFLGDSFVFGTNVRYEDSMPAVLQKTLAEGYDVYGMGVQGYGPDQSLVQLMRQGLYFQPDIVVLAVYPSNDFNDLYKNNIFDLDSEGRLIKRKKNLVEEGLPRFDTATLLRQAWLRLKHRLNPSYVLIFNELYGAENVRLYESLFADGTDPEFLKDPDSAASRHKKQLMREVLKRFKGLLEDRGVRFIVMILPSATNIDDDTWYRNLDIPRERDFLYEDTVTEICRQEGIETLNLYPSILEYQKKNSQPFFQLSDGHFSVDGYRFAVEKLTSQILAPQEV